MRCAIVIPARYGSSRLPGKPLLRASGKYLIQHVYEQAIQSKHASEVIVATDDPRILAAVKSFGGKAMMTRKDHPSGTDRVAEVARSLDADYIINLQGDEPLLDASTFDKLPELLERDPQAQLATLAVPFQTDEAFRSPNCVKVVCDQRGRALYFSRSPIPHVREGAPDFLGRRGQFLHHLGLYAYRREALFTMASLPPSPLEELEKLEQLRVLSMGWIIQVGVVEHAGRGVDTPEDYERFLQVYRSSHRRIAA